MGRIAEQAEWYRRKKPILTEMTDKRNAFLDAVAARGFTTVPGFLIDSVTNLELSTKQALSELSYEITAAAVERDLAQQGVDYDVAFKNAMTAWELDKAALLDALTRELAVAKTARENREEVLAALAVEVSLRQVALINAKTSIDIESEELKKKIAESEGLPMEKEVRLAQERLTTAQKKLEIIPHLQALITAEEELIAAEESNAAYSQDLIDDRLAQIPIKEDLFNLKEHMITARDALTNHLLSAAEKKNTLAEARLNYETDARRKITPANNLVTAIRQLNAAMQVYINKRGELVDPYRERATKLSNLIGPTDEYTAELLNTIPFIEELAKKRQGLISPGIAKAEALRQLIPPLLRKAEKSIEHAQTLQSRVAVEEAIKELSYDFESLKKVGIDADLEVMNKRLIEGDTQKALVAAEVELRRIESMNQAMLLDGESSNTIEYLTEKRIAQTLVVDKEKEAASAQIDKNYEAAVIRMKSRYDSVKTTVEARAGTNGSIEKIGRYNADEREETAEIAAAANITSSLIHQIS